MSQRQQTLQQQPHKQGHQPKKNVVDRNKNVENRRKRSKTRSDHVVNGEPKVFSATPRLSAELEANKTLHTSVEKLQGVCQPTTIVSRKDAGSNWDAVASASQQRVHQQKTPEQENEARKSEEVVLTKSARRRLKLRAAENKYVAMDCEMVGVGVNGQDDMLARVSIVSKRGEVLLDKFVKPMETVTDYRTSISGIRPHDINNGEEFKDVQNEVVQMLQGKILIGHAIRNDLAVLHIKHPDSSTRDTSRYKPLCRMVSNGRTPSLKRLTQAILGKEIQTGEHNSVEDARAAMSIYNMLASDWEAYVTRHQRKTSK